MKTRRTTLTERKLLYEHKFQLGKIEVGRNVFKYKFS